MLKFNKGRHRKDICFEYIKDINEVVISDEAEEDYTYLTKQDLLDMLNLFEEQEQEKE